MDADKLRQEKIVHKTRERKECIAQNVDVDYSQMTKYVRIVKLKSERVSIAVGFGIWQKKGKHCSQR